MRKDVETKGCVLGRVLADWEIIQKVRGALSAVRGWCTDVTFYSKISCSDFDSCGEFLENNYAKKTQAREPTNIMKYTKSLKKAFQTLLILELNTKRPKIRTSRISFRRYITDNNADRTQ